jgi:hypothetical protein
MPKTEHNPAKMKKAAAKYFETDGARLVSKSKVKGLCAAMGLRMDGTLPDELAKIMVQTIFKGAMRAVDNKRSTVKPSDL